MFSSFYFRKGAKSCVIEIDNNDMSKPLSELLLPEIYRLFGVPKDNHEYVFHLNTHFPYIPLECSSKTIETYFLTSHMTRLDMFECPEELARKLNKYALEWIELEKARIAKGSTERTPATSHLIINEYESRVKRISQVNSAASTRTTEQPNTSPGFFNEPRTTPQTNPHIEALLKEVASGNIPLSQLEQLQEKLNTLINDLRNNHSPDASPQ